MLTLMIFAVSLSSVVSLTVDDLYPYPYDDFSTADDQLLHRNDDRSSSAILFSFPYFNNVQTSAYVNTNGDITFGSSLSSYSPVVFPLNDSNVMIAAFWTDIDTTTAGQIWYNISTNSDLLTRAASDVQSAFSDQNDFNPQTVFMITWHEVPYYAASGNDSLLRNTFQIVLTTDGSKSFVMFHYFRLDWSKNAMVGFNAGDGVNSYTINGSLSDDVVNLVNRSNVGVPGKFLFRVDGGAVQPADQDDISSKTGMYYQQADWIIRIKESIPVELQDRLSRYMDDWKCKKPEFLSKIEDKRQEHIKLMSKIWHRRGYWDYTHA